MSSKYLSLPSVYDVRQTYLKLRRHEFPKNTNDLVAKADFEELLNSVVARGSMQKGLLNMLEGFRRNLNRKQFLSVLFAEHWEFMGLLMDVSIIADVLEMSTLFEIIEDPRSGWLTVDTSWRQQRAQRPPVRRTLAPKPTTAPKHSRDERPPGVILAEQRARQKAMAAKRGAAEAAAAAAAAEAEKKRQAAASDPNSFANRLKKNLNPTAPVNIPKIKCPPLTSEKKADPQRVVRFEEVSSSGEEDVVFEEECDIPLLEENKSWADECKDQLDVDST